MDAPVIRVEGLTKRYGSARGVEALTFDVRRGEVFGFLGPNGAGKTTTLRLLLDVLRPTAGRIEVFGMEPRRAAVATHARIGYLAGEPGFPDRVTAREELRYLANLRGGVSWSAVEALATRLDLDLTRRVGALSRGNRQKLGLVQALMHDPELLILDEPTGGLDPLMQQEFNRIVRERKAAGRTILLSSHILPEVEALCDRVAIVREGRLVTVEDVAALKSRLVRQARIRFPTPPSASALDGVPGVTDARVENGELVCSVRGPTGPLVRALAAMGVEDLALREPTLEEAFLSYYEKEADA